MTYDIAIIGGGVTGCAIARALSRFRLNVCVLEKHEDVACETSKANSAIVHAGYDAEPGTLMARLNVLGNGMYDEMCADLNVPLIRTGSLVLAFDGEDVIQLRRLKENGDKSGVPGLEILTKERITEKEPLVNPDVVAALWAPTGGITCPYLLTVALGEVAAQNGVRFLFSFAVSGMSREEEDGTVAINSEDGQTVRARYVINAAGLFADSISAMLGGRKFSLHPRKGEYLLLDRTEGGMARTIIFQTPSKMGKGILVTPTVDHNLLLGPTALNITDKADVSTTPLGIAEIIEFARRSVPSLRLNKVITSFSGLRAVVMGMQDFIIERDQNVQNLIQASGICSPGLTSAPAIAEYVVEILSQAGLELKLKEDYIGTRPAGKPFREMDWQERARAIAENPKYGQIVCRCETVTEAEILNAIRGPLPVTTLDGVKRRTRAGMGRCQGGFCAPRVMEILSRETGIPMENLTKFGGRSLLLAGKIKEARCDD